MADLVIDGNLSDDEFNRIFQEAEEATRQWPEGMKPKNQSKVEGYNDLFPGLDEEIKAAQKEGSKKSKTQPASVSSIVLSTLIGGYNSRSLMNMASGGDPHDIFFNRPDPLPVLNNLISNLPNQIISPLMNPGNAGLSSFTGVGKSSTQALSALAPTAGSLVGGMIGGPAGAALGGTIGQIVGPLGGGMVESALSLLESIDKGVDDMSKELVGISPQVTLATIDRQLRVLDSQFKRSESIGDTLAAIQTSKGDLEVALRGLADKFIAEFGPMMVLMIQMLSEGVKHGSTIASLTSAISNFYHGPYAMEIRAIKLAAEQVADNINRETNADRDLFSEMLTSESMLFESTLPGSSFSPNYKPIDQLKGMF